MALTVETGAGLAGADAFISVAYADAYFTARGTAAWTGTSDAKEQAIIRATAYIDNAFSYQGEKRNGRAQALSWPRVWVVDRDRDSVPSDEVPAEVQKATAEAALRELTLPGALAPDYTPSKRIKGAKLGPINVEYDLSRTDAASARPMMNAVLDLLRPLLASGAGGGVTARAVR